MNFATIGLSGLQKHFNNYGNGDYGVFTKKNFAITAGAMAITQLFATTVNHFLSDKPSCEEADLRLNLITVSNVGTIISALSLPFLSGTPKKISLASALFFIGLARAAPIYKRDEKVYTVVSSLAFLAGAEYWMRKN